MLHTETVEPRTLSLLKKLMVLTSLKPFALVGGTALSLRYGHRSSIDLDLFFHEKFNHHEIIDERESDKKLLKTETLYLPNSSMKALLDNPAI